MRTRTIIILILFPLIFLWALTCKLTSISEEFPPQKRQPINAAEPTIHVLEKPPTTVKS